MQPFVRGFASQGPWRVYAAVTAALALAGCHHDSRQDPTPSKYTVGGTVSGLSGSLVLKNNGADDLAVSTAGSFSFRTALATGSAYNVTVSSQPAGQTCSVSSGAGTVSSGNVTNIQVACKTNTYTVGGTISGLTASGLVLANGSDTVSPASQATSFVFPTAVATGTAYAVSVQTQPTGLSCTVTAGAGTVAGSNVSAVQVTCATVQPTGQWLWLGGPDIAGQSGVYGTQGTGAVGNIPGSRSAAATWIDSSGKLWLFGGAGGADVGGAQLNDLWSYDPASGLWTWVSGSSVSDTGGVYGTKGTPAAGNVPGARESAVSWLDSAGNLWLFGGVGRDSARARGWLNDLWKYDVKAGQWTWVSGSNTIAAQGVYGIQGQAGPANTPGARAGAAGWVDGSGGLWLFGGMGDNSSSSGMLDDVWKFDPGTGQWSWMSGPDAVNQSGLYGPQGSAGAGSLPGGRWKMQLTRDSSGKVWLYGGQGLDATDQFDSLGDLWSYDPATGQWTWMGGSRVIDTGAVYGTLGIADSNNTPGSRSAAVSWVDSAGNLWLTGGDGYDVKQSSLVTFADLWKFDPQSGKWAWAGGPNTSDESGVYGTLGTPAETNMPGSRSGAAAWLDGSGHLWMFGGFGFDSEGVNSRLNDLWQLGH